MSYAFAGVIGCGGEAALEDLRRAIGGVGRLMSEPFAGFVHCAFPGPAAPISPADRDALLAFSRRRPAEVFAWIEVMCWGGAREQSGFCFADGVMTHVEPRSMDQPAASVLMRLCAQLGHALPSPAFAPFAREYFDFDDSAWMSRALALARRQLGKVAPNPAVGCLIVQRKECVGDGATGPGGRPHAEEIALDAAGEAAAGATAYVSLEPCSARTSGALSCTQRLIEAGVARVVIGCADPNPAAARGADALRAAGVDVSLGILQADALALNAGFFKRLQTGRPWVAIDESDESHDCELAPAPGESPADLLDRLGAQGVTRVFVRPGSQAALQLQAFGLVDED